MNGTVNIEIAHVNVLHVRMKYAKNTRNNCPNAKKYSMTMPVSKRLLGPTKIQPFDLISEFVSLTDFRTKYKT